MKKFMQKNFYRMPFCLSIDCGGDVFHLRRFSKNAEQSLAGDRKAPQQRINSSTASSRDFCHPEPQAKDLGRDSSLRFASFRMTSTEVFEPANTLPA
jgi:hypothetical protein